MTDVPDYKKIFRLAESYTEASLILRREMGGDGFEKSAPRLLVDSFAVELYLKCLYVLDTNKKPKRGHDWLKLFQALKPETQLAIREEFKRIIDSDVVLRNLETINPEAAKLKDFNRSLEAAKDTFDKRRYVYEGFSEKEWFYGHMLQQSVRNIAVMDIRLSGEVAYKDE